MLRSYLLNTVRTSHVSVQSLRATSKKSNVIKQKWIEPMGYDTGIKIYNCVAKAKVPLILRNRNLASWYSCGPTVYDSTHIGHASCYIKLDVIQRILQEYFQLKLVTLMGITDIDDKIIARSKETKETHTAISKRYENEFWNDLQALNVKLPNLKGRVTDYIPEIIRFIEKLLNANQAYVSKDGSVYFKTTQFKNYGKLQNLNLDGRTAEGKESTIDFALWKSAKTDEPSWESPWGSGRPGWHIECSAIASRLLGSVIDFHAGGIDLQFPHHENEEAQSCSYHNSQQWVNYWIHTGHLQLKESGKMSKSIKNTISVKDFLSKYNANVLRTACLLSHYRSQLDYSDDLMKHSASVLNKITLFLDDCNAYTSNLKPQVAIDEVMLFYQMDKCQEKIAYALRDDFDTSKCISALLNLITATNKTMNSGRIQEVKYQIAEGTAIIAMVCNFVTEVIELFGLNINSSRKVNDNIDIENILNTILSLRNNIRETAIIMKEKSLFDVSDKIRNAFKDSGVEIRDHGNKSSWSFISKK